MSDVSVLFANDDVLTQWVMSEVLSEAGFNVVSACRPDQVVALLDGSPEFDVLLVDLALTDCAQPWDIGQVWQRARPGRPVIYTGPSRAAFWRPLRPAETFLATPFSAAALLRAVESALEEAWFRPAVPRRFETQPYRH